MSGWNTFLSSMYTGRRLYLAIAACKCQVMLIIDTAVSPMIDIEAKPRKDETPIAADSTRVSLFLL